MVFGSAFKSGFRTKNIRSKKLRSLILLSFDGFSFKLGFQFMLKVLISQISDKKLILETSTKFFQTFLKIYTNSVQYAN